MSFQTRSILILTPDAYQKLCKPGDPCICGVIAQQAKQLFPTQFDEINSRMHALCKTKEFCNDDSRMVVYQNLNKPATFFHKLGVETVEAFRAILELLKKGAKWVKKEFKKLEKLLKKEFGKLGKKFKSIKKKFLSWFSKHHSKNMSKELKLFGKEFKSFSSKFKSASKKLKGFGVKISKHLSKGIKKIKGFFKKKKGCKCKFDCPNGGKKKKKHT